VINRDPEFIDVEPVESRDPGPVVLTTNL